jgi:hypothetical protein
MRGAGFRDTHTTMLLSDPVYTGLSGGPPDGEPAGSAA